MANVAPAVERVLVAGSTGYLGGFVVHALQQHGVQVTALVGPNSSGSTVEQLTALGATTVKADVSKPSSRSGCAAVPDLVRSIFLKSLPAQWPLFVACRYHKLRSLALPLLYYRLVQGLQRHGRRGFLPCCWPGRHLGSGLAGKYGPL